MLDFNDPRRPNLKAGYKIPVDLRPFLAALESNEDPETASHELWGEIHHQGDVGEGSFVAVPHLVRIHRERGVIDSNTYAMVLAVELARGRDGNSDVPDWARESYEAALKELADLAIHDLQQTDDPEAVQYILGFLALAHGAKAYARLLSLYSEEELAYFEQQAM